jgi:hypothetical protein
MFKAGQIVVISGEPKLYEIRGPARYSGGVPVEYDVMAASGRGFQRLNARMLRLPTADELAEGRRLFLIENAAADEENQRRAAARIKEKVEKHRDFLIRRGVVPSDSNQEFAASVLARELRVTHCYSCYAKISNETQIECRRCRWIVCDCGACGCGHPDFKDRFTGEPQTTLREDFPPDRFDERVASVEFADFSDGVAFIKANKNYRLARNDSGCWQAVKITGG